MLVGIISDIHGNDAGLEAAIAALRARGAADIVCCGDIVGYSAAVQRVLAIVRRENIVCVAGNHDAMVTKHSWPSENAMKSAPLMYAAETLSVDDLQWLASLPVIREYRPDERQIVMMHGAPDDPLEGYLHPHLAFETEIPGDAEFLFVGHTHMQFRAGAIVNPGSCGLARDGDPRAACTLFDTETGETTELRVPYDPSSVAEANASAGFDPVINQHLFAGQKLPAALAPSRLSDVAGRLNALPHASGFIAGEAIALSLQDGTTIIRSLPLKHYWEEREVAPAPAGFEIRTSKVSTYYEMRDAVDPLSACLQLLERK